MRKTRFAVVALAAAAVVALLAVGTQAGADARPQRYIVVYSPSATKELKATVAAAKGRVLRANDRIGVATVFSSNPEFRSTLSSSRIVQGIARDRVIGRAGPGKTKKAQPRFAEEFLRSARKAARGMKANRRASRGYSFQHHGIRAEPLAPHQWDMRMIHATVDGSYRKEQGDRRVLVGIIDTGVDGKHPDIAENFSRKLSRNFTVDIPFDPLSPTEEIDGPCTEEPDQSCNDANDVDENSHGTHVASTVGSPINGIGMAGVAPDVTLVNLRAGQDSGFFFLQPSVDALTYAGDHGIDVVNMSYFIDPWLYNCRGLAGDSPAETADQVAIIEAAQRALDYAHLHGVTLVGAAGNSLTDLANPNQVDTQSPNFPLHKAHPRNVNNSCLDLPTEGNNVISVSSVGPSKIKADYSNYGYGEIDVAAPGGWSRDEPWNLSMTPAERTAASIPNLILAAYPEAVGREAGDIDANGNPTNGFVVKSCKGSKCAYYQWIQGTSMAAPHVTGVAALIISEYGERRWSGISLHPLFTQAYLEASATDTPCMTPNPFTYTHKGRSAAYTTWCEGTPVYNGVYGHGIVDALRAVTIGEHADD